MFLRLFFLSFFLFFCKNKIFTMKPNNQQPPQSEAYNPIQVKSPRLDEYLCCARIDEIEQHFELAQASNNLKALDEILIKIIEATRRLKTLRVQTDEALNETTKATVTNAIKTLLRKLTYNDQRPLSEKLAEYVNLLSQIKTLLKA